MNMSWGRLYEQFLTNDDVILQPEVEFGKIIPTDFDVDKEKLLTCFNKAVLSNKRILLVSIQGTSHALFTQNTHTWKGHFVQKWPSRRRIINNVLGNVDSDETTNKALSNPEIDFDFKIVMNNVTIYDLTPIQNVTNFKETLCQETYDKPCEQILNWL